ncbi:MAG: hypothetical protein A2W90_22880 [Bacteroidetes bacterium GWF2_42_66]|nr:MAG: hypothetical protein A2W92_02690 [Bacteroidetes bacterium GWA2_42_15]OFX99458.1 MAG: hypothetical protein A2W89_12565 [Bacteroidetes bacterium GWE2_42_39]OFY46989.1 MAG: hypothetical protein A2W90_22880 [Bacteroidetes bacterium GWF2_42_66]HBL76860.1 hypothetical protein [Prolixibacteraceae bacterium]HCR90495.1 hypothetical protein [Prolixibacteraceae bacterium]
MRKISTLTYFIKTYQQNGQKNEFLSEEIFNGFNDDMYEPAPESINAILRFARSYEVLESNSAGNIELNLN